MSQRYARPFSWAAMRCVPSGVKIGKTPEWGAPGSGVPSAWPLSTSHRLTVPSVFPVASMRPFGLNATRAALRPANHGLAGLHVPFE